MVEDLRGGGKGGRSSGSSSSSSSSSSSDSSNIRPVSVCARTLIIDSHMRPFHCCRSEIKGAA